MANHQLGCVLDHVQKLIGIRRNTELTDCELLERFLRRQDESAFEMLVRRHGPMVLRVCRRVLGDLHDAEDAFQATFLVLARKAGLIRQRGSVGGWLYEVAYHLAIRAKSGAARRHWHERRAQDMPTADGLSEEDREELQAALDEELHRLPEKYRTPLVLCYLEGKTNVQAAREIGCPAGSMSTRLARGRELLRDRLSGRGIALSAAGVTVLLGENAAPAAVPAALVHNTVQAAVLFAAGKTSLAALVSAKAVYLAQGMLNTMISTKLKLVAAVLLAVSLLGTGTSVLVQQDAVAQPAAAAADDKPSANPPADARKADQFGDPLPDGALARLGTLRWRHGAAVTMLGYVDGGKQLLTVSQDGFIRVWETATGKEIRRFGKGGVVDAATGKVMVDAGGGVMMVGTANIALTSAISPDGQMLATAGQDGTIRLWEISTGKELRSLAKAQAGRVYYGAGSLVFSPDSKSLAVKGQDQTIRLYEAATGNETRQIGKADPKRRIYFAGGNSSVSFSPDGKSIATIAMELDQANQRANGVIQFYEVETGKEQRQIKLEQNNFGVASAAFSPNWKHVVWAGNDGGLRVYDIESGKEIRQLGQGQQGQFVNTMLFSPDGKVLATRPNTNPGIQLYDIDTGKELRTLGEQPNAGGANALILIRGYGLGGPQTIAFSPDGKVIAEATPGNSIRLWDVATGKDIPPTAGHQGGVHNLVVSPDNKVVTTYGADNTIRQWETATGKEVREFKLPAGAGNVALSTDGKLVAAGTPNNTVVVYDIAAGKEIRSIQIPGQQNAVGMVPGQGGIALSPDGKTLAVRSFDATIYLFETATGRQLHLLSEQQPNPNNPAGVVFVGGSGLYKGQSQGLVFSPDGMTLAAQGSSPFQAAAGGGVNVRGVANNSVRLWNVALGKPTGRLEGQQRGFNGVAFSPDGWTMVTANTDNTVSVWEVVTGKESFQFKMKADEKPAPKPQPGGVQPAIARLPYGQAASSTIAISHDGRTLAIGGADWAVRLYDLGTGKELGEFKGHQGQVLSVAFSPDGKAVLSGSADTTALVWAADRFVKHEALPPVELQAKQVDDLWNDLLADSGKAEKAVQTLVSSPKQAVALFQERVKPATGIDVNKIDQLIKDLESSKFDVREKSEEELARLGEHAQPALQKVLDSNPSLETRQRVERLLEKLATGQPPTGDVLRAIRAVRVLEMVGTPEAKQLLQTLAKGAPGDKTTRYAESSLRRLAK